MKIRLVSWNLVAVFLCSACYLNAAKDRSPDIRYVDSEHRREGDRLLPALRQYLQSPRDVVLRTSPVVSVEEARRDIEFLKVALRGSYAGYDVASAAGLDWNSVLDGLATDRELPGRAWKERIANAFSQLGDGHFALAEIDEAGQYIDYSSTMSRTRARFEPEPACAAGEPSVVPYFLNGVIVNRSVIFSDSPPRGDGCSWKRVDLKRVARSPEFTVVALAPGISYVRAHAFSMRDEAAWSTFQATAADLRSKSTIVIDLRGNTGGNSSGFHQWLEALYGRRLPFELYEKLESPWTTLQLVNYFQREITMGSVDSSWQEHARTWRQRYLDQLALVTPEGLNKRQWTTYDSAATHPEPAGTASAGFDGRVIVLVDRYCESACETAVKALLQIDGVVLAGEHTAGVALMGENGFRRLPGSGVAIQWGSWIERDLRTGFAGFSEGVGFAPDLWLAPGAVETHEEILVLVAAIPADFTPRARAVTQ